jgi:RecQ family ATP-dependent DNA helicase
MSLASAAEDAEARKALQGIDDIESPVSAPRRLYEGAPDADALLTHLGYAEFRPGQRDAVEAALAGRDSMIVMPTGGGKSLCYQLPALATGDLTIVVSPLIALMADQWKRLADGGHPAAMIASGLGEEATRDSLRSISSGEARIVYCSPERFGSTSFWRAVEQRKVDIFAVDEAHCVSEWGHDFRPDYLRLPKAIERLGRPTVIACTATATHEVADEIRTRLGLDDPLEIRAGFDRPNLSFDTVQLEGKGTKARKLGLLEHGLRDLANRPAIVYCGTRKDTEEVASVLSAGGVKTAGYHAGMAPDERASVQHRFMSGEIEVITATNAFGMGVDKANVRSVWHYAIPSSVEAYYQEAGRAGRDGLPARAVLLAGRSDLGRLVRFIEMRKVDPEAVIAYLRRLDAAAGGDELEIDNPRDDGERIRLAIAEREGAIKVDPAPGGRLRVRVVGGLERGQAAKACRFAEDRGWRAYRAVEAFAFSDTCRRRALLDHFGDPTPGAAEGRCCDACDEAGLREWLPDPETISINRKTPGKSRGGSGEAEAQLSDDDTMLFERLKEWRLTAAAGKPAYTVAHNRTLAEIASKRPAGPEALGSIYGVGPAFVKKHGDAVLELLDAA